MEALRHYIDFLDGNGFVEVRPPMEWKELSLEISFLNADEKLSAEAFTWPDADQGTGAISVAKGLNDHVADGLTGGVGIFEGLPYQVRLICDNTVYVVLDCAINLAAPDAEFRCDMVKAPVREVGKIDFISQRAESFRFEYLYSLPAGDAGRITNSDFINIYYQIGRYPQGVEIMVAGLTLYVTLKEIYEVVKRIADAVAAVLGGATGVAESTAQIIALIAYLVLLIVAIINLVQQLIDLIFPWVYYHKGMLEITLWQRACEFLGLTYTSSIHSIGGIGHNNYIMPEKQGVFNGATGGSEYRGVKVGFPSQEKGFFNGTFADFIRGQIEKYNGKIKIIGNNLYFETEMTYLSQATWNIPEVKHEFYGYNASEVAANYLIAYQYDPTDLYCLSSPGGVLFQVTVTPTMLQNKQNIMLRNLEQRQIPYALSAIKANTSDLEAIMSGVFNAFAGLVNSIASLTGVPTVVFPTIPSSNNVLRLDTHFTSIARTGVYLGGGYTSPATGSIIGAEQLFYALHFYRLVKPIGSYTPGNQWKRYRGYKVPMCCEDYLTLKDMNYAYYKGVPARLLSISWNPYDQVADIDFEVNEKYTDNLSATIYRSGDQSLAHI